MIRIQVHKLISTYIGLVKTQLSIYYLLKPHLKEGGTEKIENKKIKCLFVCVFIIRHTSYQSPHEISEAFFFKSEKQSFTLFQHFQIFMEVLDNTKRQVKTVRGINLERHKIIISIQHVITNPQSLRINEFRTVV